MILSRNGPYNFQEIFKETVAPGMGQLLFLFTKRFKYQKSYVELSSTTRYKMRDGKCSIFKKQVLSFHILFHYYPT